MLISQQWNSIALVLVSGQTEQLGSDSPITLISSWCFPGYLLCPRLFGVKDVIINC